MEKRFRNAPFSPRKSKNKPPRKRFVIICEGARTETEYFKHLREKWKRRFKKVDEYVSIEIMGPGAAGGNAPHTLVAHAIATLQETEKARKMWDKTSQVWCVFDVEAEGSIANLANIVEKARRHGIQPVISNPCFELWFYLHFQYCETAIPNGKAMIRLLKKCWPDYDKGAGDFSPLEGHYETAKQHAVRLREKPHAKLPSDPVPRPYTNVDVLVTAVETMLADLR